MLWVTAEDLGLVTSTDFPPSRSGLGLRTFIFSKCPVDLDLEISWCRKKKSPLSSYSPRTIRTYTRGWRDGPVDKVLGTQVWGPWLRSLGLMKEGGHGDLPWKAEAENPQRELALRLFGWLALRKVKGKLRMSPKYPPWASTCTHACICRVPTTHENEKRQTAIK